MKLKICGMKNSENIVEATALLPDFMGFIFWKPSPRFFIGNLPELPKSIQKVGVFVDAGFTEIVNKVLQYKLDFIQLHGNETPDFCESLQKENLKIIKTFSVGIAFDFTILEAYEPVVNYFLFDTKGDAPGGNGQSFNWGILENYNSQKPIFLSGGIRLESIANLQKLNIPIFAVDVNSKFETSPGQKNISLLQQFKNQLP
jgi:phosphoribosylanthranilate isomerase